METHCIKPQQKQIFEEISHQISCVHYNFTVISKKLLGVFSPLEYFSSKTRTPTRTRAWFYWIHVPEMLLHTCWAPWKWKLLVEANTKDGQPGSVSNPTGSTHWFASALRAAIPTGGKITTTALHYMLSCYCPGLHAAHLFKLHFKWFK